MSNNWFTPANWAPGGIPTVATDVCIPAVTPAPPEIGVGGDAEVASIESSQQIRLFNSSAIEIASTTQSSVLHDDLILGDFTTLNNAGPLAVEGTLSWGASSTIKGTGMTTIASGGALTATGNSTQRFIDNQTLRINGTATFDGATSGFFFTYLNAATLEVGSGGTLDLQDDQSIAFNGGSPLVRVRAGGTLTRTSAAGSDAAHIAIAFENDGTTSSNAGILKLDSGSGANTSTGTFSAAGGAMLNFAGSTHATMGASFTGAGTVRISNGTVNTAGATAVAAATRLELTNSILGNAGTLTVNGTVDWGNGSTISGAGMTVIPAGASLTASGNNTQRFLSNQMLRIYGTATLDGADLRLLLHLPERRHDRGPLGRQPRPAGRSEHRLQRRQPARPRAVGRHPDPDLGGGQRRRAHRDRLRKRRHHELECGQPEARLRQRRAHLRGAVQRRGRCHARLRGQHPHPVTARASAARERSGSAAAPSTPRARPRSRPRRGWS